MSTDAERWVDVLVGACGHSLLTASVFSMKKARTSAEKEDGERCHKIWKNKRYKIVT